MRSARLFNCYQCSERDRTSRSNGGDANHDEEVEAIEIALQEGSDEEEAVLEEFESEVDVLAQLDDENVSFPLADDYEHGSDEESEMAQPLQTGSTSGLGFGSADPDAPSSPIAGPSGEATAGSAFARMATSFHGEADPTSDSDDDDDSYMYEWVRNLHHFPVNAPFTTEAGLKLDMPNDADPVDFYNVFITKEMIKLMKVETNRYATSVIQEKRESGCVLSSRSLYNTWKPVTNEDITRFLAILIHMGIVHKPHLTDYWSKDPAMASSFAPAVMQRERFRAILAFFHLHDNRQFVPRDRPTHDPLHKLRPFVDHLRKTFKEVFAPYQNVCIDEALCPWRGRVSFRVYMKDKPTKWGMKVYELCDSSTGYVWDFEIMCRMPNLSNTPYDVCHRLMGPLLKKGHVLYVDNYYCNPSLAFSLAAEDTGLVGTVREHYDQ